MARRGVWRDRLGPPGRFGWALDWLREGVVIWDGEGRAVHANEDLTDPARARDALEELALRRLLTGLPNRAVL